MAQKYYTPFVVANGQVPSTQTDFAVLLKPTDNRFRTTGNSGHVASASGYDLRPYSDATLATALTFELVPGTYNASTGTFEMWVKVPSLSDGYTIYLGYGDPGLTTDGSSTSTWDSNYLLVTHFADGSSLNVSDSSQSARTMTNHSATATSGKIDGAARVNATYVNAGAITSGLSNSFTIEAWESETSRVNVGAIATSEVASYGNYWFLLEVGNNSNAKGSFALYDGSHNPFVGGNNTLSTGTLYHLAGVRDTGAGKILFYQNGAFQNNATDTVVTPPSYSAFNIGQAQTIPARALNGTIDEVRLSSVARSANWITTGYNNQSAPTTFAPTGTEVSLGGVIRVPLAGPQGRLAGGAGLAGAGW